MADVQPPSTALIHILDDDSLLNVFYFYWPFLLGEDDNERNHLIEGTKGLERSAGGINSLMFAEDGEMRTWVRSVLYYFDQMFTGCDVWRFVNVRYEVHRLMWCVTGHPGVHWSVHSRNFWASSWILGLNLELVGHKQTSTHYSTLTWEQH